MVYDDDGGGGSARACVAFREKKRISVKNHNFKKADHPHLFSKKPAKSRIQIKNGNPRYGSAFARANGF